MYDKRNKVTGDWRKLQNEQVHDLYSSPNVIFRAFLRCDRV
jgi:hypothetical protein